MECNEIIEYKINSSICMESLNVASDPQTFKQLFCWIFEPLLGLSLVSQVLFFLKPKPVNNF
jgi:hypothetical protein